MSNRRSKRPLIVIESLDAAGGSTQTGRLVKKLKREQYKPLPLHFPQADQATGQFVYEKYLRSKNQAKFSRREQALVYIQDFYSRKQDIEAHLKSSTKAIVVCDRFYTSTLAYQTAGLTGTARQRMLEWLAWLCEIGAVRLPKPDIVILLDTPPSISLQRLKGKPRDYHETLTKQRRFRNSYLSLAQQRRWKVVNGLNSRGEPRSIQDIHQEIWDHVEPLL